MGNTELNEIIQVAEFRSALRKFLSQGERIAASNGITSQWYMLLLLIKGARDGSQRSTVTELTTRLHLAQHTVTELVSRAVQAGLIRRTVSKADRRVVHLRLSAKGEQLFQLLFEALRHDRQILAELLKDLGTVDRRDRGSHL